MCTRVSSHVPVMGVIRCSTTPHVMEGEDLGGLLEQCPMGACMLPVAHPSPQRCLEQNLSL